MGNDMPGIVSYLFIKYAARKSGRNIGFLLQGSKRHYPEFGIDRHDLIKKIVTTGASLPASADGLEQYYLTNRIGHS
jgi:hypothetical protein